MLRLLATTLVALVLALGAGTAAAAPVDDARASAAAARDTLARLDAERAGLAAENERLGAEIAAVKASGRAPLLPGVSTGRLDELLKSARDVAARLEALDRDAAAARTALTAALDVEVVEVRKSLPGLTGAAQKARFEELRTLIAERERLVAASSRRVELPAAGSDASADELRELADEARDHAESVQSQLATLETRLQELQARRRLFRAAGNFARDEALFGEAERTRRVVRVDRETLAAGAANPAARPSAPMAAKEPGRDETGTGITTQDDAPGAAAPPADTFAPEAGGNDTDGTRAAGTAEAAPPADFGLPGGGIGPSAGGATGGALVVDDALDPALVVGSAENLTPQALAEHIRKIEARREALRKTAKALEDRRRELERRAHEAEVGEGQ
jgi:hypothetical protein